MKKLLFIIGIVLLLLVSSVNAENETLSLELEEDRFLEGFPIKGKLTVNFDDKVSSIGELVIGENVWNISDVLLLNSVTFETETGLLTAVNSSVSKELNFKEEGDKYLSVQLLRYATINSVEMEILGEEYDSQYPMNVTMDIGNDGSTDWYYFGSFVEFVDDFYNSTDLDDSLEGIAILTGSDSYFCELIDIPETKSLEISAEYTKLTDVGNMNMVVFSSPTGDPTNPGGRFGGGDFCDLPEESGSCVVEFDYPVQGNYLFCMYNDQSEDEETHLYELPIDTTAPTTTSFVCPLSITGFCTSNTNANFDIKVKVGNYDKEMKESVVFETWETFFGSVVEAFRFYIGGTDYFQGICEPPAGEETCVVPIKVSSDTKGNVTLSDLSIDHNPDDQDLQLIEIYFYDLAIPADVISEIEDQRLVLGESVELDLSLFNLTLPIGSHTLIVQFLGEEVNASLEVLSVEDYYTPADLIDDVQSKYTSFLTDGDENRVILMLGLDNDISLAKEKVDGYEVQVGFVSDSEMLMNVESAIGDLPWEVTFSNKYSDIQIVEPGDISPYIGGNEVYFQQDDVTVTESREIVTLTTYNGDSEKYNYITKSVRMNKAIDNLEVYIVGDSYETDLLPTSVAENVGKYVVGSVSSGEVKSYYYLTADGDLSDYKTIITHVEEEEEEEVVEEVVEEKNYSELVYWILGMIVFLGGLIAFIYYMFFNSRVKIKNPIVDKKEDSDISEFVSSSRKKGISDQVIKKVLMSKGWSKAKIDAELKR